MLPEAVRLTEERQMWRETVDAITGLNGSHGLEERRKETLKCITWPTQELWL